MKQLFAKHRILSLIVAVAIIFSAIPLTAAEEDNPLPDSGLL